MLESIDNGANPVLVLEGNNSAFFLILFFIFIFFTIGGFLVLFYIIDRLESSSFLFICLFLPPSRMFIRFCWIVLLTLWRTFTLSSNRVNGIDLKKLLWGVIRRNRVCARLEGYSAFPGPLGKWEMPQSCDTPKTKPEALNSRSKPSCGNKCGDNPHTTHHSLQREGEAF